MIVKRAVVDADRVFEFRGAHLTTVDEAIEDFVASPVPDCGVHIEVPRRG